MNRKLINYEMSTWVTQRRAKLFWKVLMVPIEKAHIIAKSSPSAAKSQQFSTSVVSLVPKVDGLVPASRTRVRALPERDTHRTTTSF